MLILVKFVISVFNMRYNDDRNAYMTLTPKLLTFTIHDNYYNTQ